MHWLQLLQRPSEFLLPKPSHPLSPAKRAYLASFDDFLHARETRSVRGQFAAREEMRNRYADLRAERDRA